MTLIPRIGFGIRIPSAQLAKQSEPDMQPPRSAELGRCCAARNEIYCLFRAKSTDVNCYAVMPALRQNGCINIEFHHMLEMDGFATTLIWARGLDLGVVFHQPHSEAKRARYLVLYYLTTKIISLFEKGHSKPLQKNGSNCSSMCMLVSARRLIRGNIQLRLSWDKRADGCHRHVRELPRSKRPWRVTKAIPSACKGADPIVRY